MRPTLGPIYLLWPTLYGIHAILVVAGTPIQFEGQWASLNLLIPTIGYGMLTGLVGFLLPGRRHPGPDPAPETDGVGLGGQNHQFGDAGRRLAGSRQPDRGYVVRVEGVLRKIRSGSPCNARRRRIIASCDPRPRCRP